LVAWSALCSAGNHSTANAHFARPVSHSRSALTTERTHSPHLAAVDLSNSGPIFCATITVILSLLHAIASCPSIVQVGVEGLRSLVLFFLQRSSRARYWCWSHARGGHGRGGHGRGGHGRGGHGRGGHGRGGHGRGGHGRGRGRCDRWGRYHWRGRGGRHGRYRRRRRHGRHRRRRRHGRHTRRHGRHSRSRRRQGGVQHLQSKTCQHGGRRTGWLALSTAESTAAFASMPAQGRYLAAERLLLGGRLRTPRGERTRASLRQLLALRRAERDDRAHGKGGGERHHCAAPQ
jgi:hypothetical protein